MAIESTLAIATPILSAIENLGILILRFVYSRQTIVCVTPLHLYYSPLMDTNRETHWLPTAKDLLERGNYAEAAAIYEAAIEQDPDILSYYWHLGVLLLLQEKEEEAQMAWMMGLTAGEEEEEDSIRELVAVLEAEIERQERLGNDRISWILRQHLLELDAENPNIILSTWLLSLKLELFDPEAIAVSEMVNLLADEDADIDSQLLVEVRRSLLDFDPEHPAILEFDRACTQSPHFVPPFQLHIGGTTAHPDWKILDIEPREEVDFVGDAADLSQFEDNAIDTIYASHVLEHFHHHLKGEVANTLAEWYRVLKPGGKLMVSVPDLQTLCWLYLQPQVSFKERLRIMWMLYGGQSNEFDVHKVGFDFEILRAYLSDAGFTNYYRVKSFNLFRDCSQIRVGSTFISLNVVAFKPANCD